MTDTSVKSEQNQIVGRFVKGVSGNPAGKPKGSLHKATKLLQSLFADGIEEIGLKAIELAKAGDIQAIKLVVERILPAKKDIAIMLDLPIMRNAHDINMATDMVIKEVSEAEITPLEGKSVIDLIEHKRQVLETVELENKLKELETVGKE